MLNPAHARSPSLEAIDDPSNGNVHEGIPVWTVRTSRDKPIRAQVQRPAAWIHPDTIQQPSAKASST